MKSLKEIKRLESLKLHPLAQLNEQSAIDSNSEVIDQILSRWAEVPDFVSEIFLPQAALAVALMLLELCAENCHQENNKLLVGKKISERFDASMVYKIEEQLLFTAIIDRTEQCLFDFTEGIPLEIVDRA